MLSEHTKMIVFEDVSDSASHGSKGWRTFTRNLLQNSRENK